MATRLHHTQVKQAAKLGITLAKNDLDITASKDGKSASAPSVSLAIAALLKLLGTSTVDLMGTIKASKPAKAKKAKTAKKGKAKFKCECGSTKRVKDEDPDGGFVCAECGNDATMDGDEDGNSVIKAKYKNKYRPHKMTCGDALSKQVRAEFMTIKDPDTKKLKLDWVKFRQFAKNNGCWSEDYSKLNKGMRRMNIVNRLRAKIADGHETIWAV